MMTKKELNSTHQRTTELVWAINALANGTHVFAYHAFCDRDGCAIKIAKDCTILAYQLRDVLNITGLCIRAFDYGDEPEYIFFKASKHIPDGFFKTNKHVPTGEVAS